MVFFVFVFCSIRDLFGAQLSSSHLGCFCCRIWIVKSCSLVVINSIPRHVAEAEELMGTYSLDMLKGALLFPLKETSKKSDRVREAFASDLTKTLPSELELITDHICE